MMYEQLCNRESLCDLVFIINACSQKAYHLGFRKGISKTNLAKANENRDSQIYQDFAYHLISEARKICISENILSDELTSPVYAFDSLLHVILFL
jgi:hypothetical protein